MKRYQRGASTLDIAITLTFLSAMFIIAVSTLVEPFNRYRAAGDIERNISRVKQASIAYYGAQVMDSRCLSVAPMTLSQLVSNGYLDSDINQSLYQFSVDYRTVTITPTLGTPWQRPTAIEVSVTFSNVHELARVVGKLTPNHTSARTLRFDSPLSMTDRWLNIDKNTGCIP